MFFWNSLAFSMIQRMLAICSLVLLPFLKPAWRSGGSWFMFCWSLAWRILSIILLRYEVKSFSRVWLFATPWTVAYQAPLSLGFSMQECWSGLPFPSPRESSQPRDQTQVSCIAGRLFTIWATREAHSHVRWVQLYGSLNILWHCLSLGLEWKLTFSSPVATLGTENSAKQGNSWSSHYSRRDK